MKLFEHNQKAFDEAERRFASSNRTCIIHPTGTGKSLIIAEFIRRYSNKRHLVLAPGRHIKDEIAKHVDLRFRFITYASVKKHIDDLPLFDYIYLDEFHRVGADQWGEGVRELLSANPKAKILGVSATPIRYLDDHRNMATEIFNDNVSSNISLAEAIAKNILLPPKYIAALYSIQEESQALIKKIRSSNSIKKNELIDKVKSNLIDWEKSGGIDAIIKKHLNPARDRIIVFCKNRGHMTVAKDVVLPALREIWDKVEPIEIYSKFTEESNGAALAQFADPSQSAKVLFTIDKLNEGLHVKGVNTVILMRDTVSPTIFYQQIGRCFSASQKDQPLIFDLVNNFSSVRVNEFQKDVLSHTGSIKASQSFDQRDKFNIEFIDETKHWSDIFESISSAIVQWDVAYSELKEYHQIHGNINVPVNHQLYKWIGTQRYMRYLGNISNERVSLLDDLGMVWNSYDEAFESIMSELEEYVKINGKLPSLHDNKFLWQWLASRRREYKKGILKEWKMIRIAALAPLDDSIERKWQEQYDEAASILAKDGKLPSSRSDKLANWIQRQKKVFDTLPQSKQIKLSQIGISPSLSQDEIWNTSFDELLNFVVEHRRLPTSSEVRNASSWYKRNKENIFKLTKEKQDKLRSIESLCKNPLNARFEEWIRSLDSYISAHRGMPRKITDKKLHQFTLDMKKRRRSGTLSQDRINALNKAGFIWE